MVSKRRKKLKNKKRVRSKISGTAKRPRVSVFRSNKHVYVQMIDDVKSETVIAVSDKSLPQEVRKGKLPKEIARLVGEQLAKKALKMKIESGVFDRGAYRYHGRVRALAEGLREGGLKI